MRITIETLFPELIGAWAREALVGRAAEHGLFEIRANDLRRFAGNRSGRVDDAPYGGGAGMVIRVDVAAQAIDEARSALPPADEVVLLSPAGEPLTQSLAERFAGHRHLVLLCGRYEGFDARVEQFVDREVSVADAVLMGGELAALCVAEAAVRLLPGVLGDPDSHRCDSFSSGLLDYPEYTRPPSYRGLAVPEVLRSGDHARVAAWRRDQALARTARRRPDLLARAPLSIDERRVVAALAPEDEGT
jgi:tRNA (guanine37-N1)-methyltransferase